LAARRAWRLFGLTRGTTRAHIIRAALESLVPDRDLVEARRAICRAAGDDAARGWRRFGQQPPHAFQADLLGVPVERPRVIETTALGAGLLAGLGSTLESHRDLDRGRRSGRVFEPRHGRVWREAEYGRWRRAVARCVRALRTTTRPETGRAACAGPSCPRMPRVRIARARTGCPSAHTGRPPAHARANRTRGVQPEDFLRVAAVGVFATLARHAS